MLEIKIPSLDGASFEAFAVLPKGEHGPGLIVIHELFSSLETIQKINESFAAQGYVVIAPNLFHKQGFDMKNAPAHEEPDWEQTTRLYKNFDVEAGVRDLLATLGYVRNRPECGGKVGAVGYCLGSRMAFLMASRSDVDCAVCYYGVGVDSFLDEVYDIRMPLLLHLGENDKLLPASTQQRVLKSVSKNKAITTHLYSGAEHGFVRESGQTFHPESATLANERTALFLRECLLM
ncbi:MAG: dienelactone hydrolase family protein [Alphaproteobacteria bacterium]|nr:dienelactone hydrolase family protein [Alphaproteobacteria bacterium]